MQARLVLKGGVEVRVRARVEVRARGRVEARSRVMIVVRVNIRVRVRRTCKLAEKAPSMYPSWVGFPAAIQGCREPPTSRAGCRVRVRVMVCCRYVC